MSNDVGLIYVQYSWVFINVHFRYFGELKIRFLLIRQRVYLVNDFRYTCVGIRNTCKYHLHLIVNSDWKSSDKRIPHLMSCISRTNDESLIYVILSVSKWSFSAFWPAENSISAHSSTGLINSMILYMLVFGLEISVKTTTFSL